MRGSPEGSPHSACGPSSRLTVENGERFTIDAPEVTVVLPDHILRRDQSAAGNQHGGDGNRRTRPGKARHNQKRRGEQRRGVGRRTQHADVAALHPDVPCVERGTDRTDAERNDRQPLCRGFRPDRHLDRQMDRGGEQRGCKTEAGHRIGRHRLQLARHHRICRPYEGGDKRRGQAGDLLPFEMHGCIAGKQQHRAGKPEQRADDVMGFKPLARQQRREQHDQQRPEIIQQPGFRRRRQPQRQEIQRVIAEQSADADDPHDRRLF